MSQIYVITHPLRPELKPIVGRLSDARRETFKSMGYQLTDIYEIPQPYSLEIEQQLIELNNAQLQRARQLAF